MALDNLLHLIRELRRRRVFRVAIIYGIAAVGVISACDWIFPQLGKLIPELLPDPEGAMRWVIIAAFANFPVALIFGWLYDISGDGIERTPSFAEAVHDPDSTLHPADTWIIGGLSASALAVIVVAVLRITAMDPPLLVTETLAPVPENSVAVMPFTTCAGEGLEELLGYGIADEVLRRLAEIPNIIVTAKTAKFIKVTSRASAFAFAGEDFEPERISSALRVHYVLTATVCRLGDALTLTAELVDNNGYLVWTGSFSQQEDSGGLVTRSLAAALTQGVAVKLGASLPTDHARPVDREAYAQLLIGREQRNRGNDEKARAAFERALERQPDYAEAVYELALMELPRDLDERHAQEMLEKTMLLAERAMAMARRELQANPRSAHANYVAGSISLALALLEQDLAWRETQAPDQATLNARFGQAEQLLRAAVEGNPSDSWAFYRLATAVEAQERYLEALQIFELAQARDPFNALLTQRIAKRWAARGRFREAMDMLQRFNRELPEVPPMIWWWQLELTTLHVYWDEKCAILIDILKNDPDALADMDEPLTVYNRWQIAWFTQQLQDLGLGQEAEAWRERVHGMPLKNWMREPLASEEENAQTRREEAQRLAAMGNEEILAATGRVARDWALQLAEAGELDRAIAIMKKVRHSPAIWTERKPHNAYRLAVLYKAAGRDEEAAALLRSIAGQLEKEVTAGIRHPDTLSTLAEAYALLGEDGAALSMLELAVEHRSMWLAWYDKAPVFGVDAWQRLNGNPRFLTLVQHCRDEIQRQALYVRGLLAEQDLDQLLAPIEAISGSQEQVGHMEGSEPEFAAANR